MLMCRTLNAVESPRGTQQGLSHRVGLMTWWQRDEDAPNEHVCNGMLPFLLSMRAQKLMIECTPSGLVASSRVAK